MANQSALTIVSPKRNLRLQSGWEGFFPYYAGYPEAFADTLLQSAKLSSGATVLDPWNGSGTTVYAASRLGLKSIGLDINPAMVIVARARLLPPTEADALEPLGIKIVMASRSGDFIEPGDPLLIWFDTQTASVIRSIERAICSHMVGGLSADAGDLVRHMTHFAAAIYISLFAVCRRLVDRFYSSNPTWMRIRRADERRVRSTRGSIEKKFLVELRAMAMALAKRVTAKETAAAEIRLADSTANPIARDSVDFVLSSPPYCTRIDYTAATRIELAIIAPLTATDTTDLRRAMLGSVRVPREAINFKEAWGATCQNFLAGVKSHSSKASSGYYLKTHLDYFDKLYRSITEISWCLKLTGRAAFVVQDSFYKQIRNDVPTIFSEMAENSKLKLFYREDFYLARSMSGINRHSKLYNRRPGAIESVLCFEKIC